MDFDGYSQAEQIGVGGTATVWRARQLSLGRWVAIKVLLPEFAANDDDIDRFQEEAKIAAKMDHPNIVRVYDAFYRNNAFCFVMEYVDGYTVTEWIKKQNRLPQAKCLFVARQVAEALKYAWNEHGIVHCDVKPDNIMLEYTGLIKVTDLGLFRQKDLIQKQYTDKQGEIEIFGTPSYISPEQSMGTTEISIQIDMYSLGATLYHAATGRRLFNEFPELNVMEMHVSSQYADPFVLNKELSPDFCAFIERLLAKDPKYRYNSWDDVMKEIGNLQNGKKLEFGLLDIKHCMSTVKRGPERYAEHKRSKNMITASTHKILSDGNYLKWKQNDDDGSHAYRQGKLNQVVSEITKEWFALSRKFRYAVFFIFVGLFIILSIIILLFILHVL